MASHRDRYSTIAIVLHWGIALAVLAQILLIMAGDAAPDRQTAAVWRDLHKSVGMTILALTVVRILWRLTHRPPPPVGSPAWQNVAAAVTHGLFYVVLIALPMTGWLASSAAGRDIVWFGLFDWPLLPIGGGGQVAGQFMDVHRLAVKGLYVLLALHVLAALKHQFMDRDNLLARMIPGLRRA